MTDIVQKFLLKERRKRIGLTGIKASLNKKTPSLKAIETGYNGFLQRFQVIINKEIREQIKPISAEVIRQDALSDLIESVFKDLLTFVEIAVASALLSSGVLRTADRTNTVNFKKYDKGAYKQIGLNALPSEFTDDLTKNWVKANVGLITNVNTKQLGQLETLFKDNAYSGIRAGQLKQNINKIFKGSRNNIAVIARDQVGKLNGQLDRMKQTNAGIDGYYWRTSRDERVRSSHAHREGVFFSWDRSPKDGHPGQPIQCRCDAEPAIDKMLMNRKEFEESQKQRQADNARKRKEAITKSEKGPIN